MIPVSDVWSTANAEKARTLVGRITFDRGGRKYSTHKIVDYKSEVKSDDPVLYIRFNEDSSATSVVTETSNGLAGTYVNAMGFRTLALSLGPYLYLRLNELTGTLAEDSSGNGLTGTYVNAPTLGVAGALTGESTDAAITLNGTTQYITKSDDPLLDLGTDTFSGAVWVKPSAFAAAQYIIDKGANGYAFGIDGGTGLIRLDKNAVGAIVKSTVGLTAGVWSHVAFTKSGATSKLYINGVDVTGAVTNYTIVGTASALEIGRINGGGSPFGGSLDELLLFPQALTAAEVLALYNASFGRMGVTGAIQGSSNKALLLNGISSYVSVADDALLDLGTDVLTISLWAKFTDVSGTQMLINKGVGGYSIAMIAGVLYIQKADTANIATSTITLVAGTDYYIVWTKSGATNHLYVNGADVTGAVTNATIAATASALYIGRNYDSQYYVHGSIDELALFATALSPARVLAEYNASQLRQYLTVSADKIGYYATVLQDAPSAWWHFGDQSGTVAREVMNGLDGAYVGNPTLGVAGAINGNSDTAVTLNGSTQYIRVPDAALLDPGDVFSLECWVIRFGVTLDCLFDKGSNGYRLRIIAAADGNYLRLSKVGGAVICTSTVPVFLDAGTWHHLVATKSGADVHLYIDGVDVSGAITNATIAATAIDLYIGVVNGGGSDWLQGSIDEPAIYPTALSAARVLAHYVAGSQDRSITGADPYIALIRSVASQIGTRTSKSSLSAMKFNITDVDGEFTEFMSEGLGGDKVTYDVGFRTIQGEDFATFFTGNVEAVDLPDKLNEYEVTIRDPQVLTSKKIFTVASGLLTQNLATIPGSRYFHWITVTTPPLGRLPVNDNSLDVAAFTIAYDAYWGAGNWSFYKTSEAADGTNINMADTSAFSDAGDVVVDNEIISYTSKTATTLTGLTRQVGAASAIVGPHFIGARATEVFHLGPDHPLDILLDIYQNSSPDGLAIPADRIDLAGIAAAKALIGSTYEMEFWPSDPVDAKSWLEQEIFAPLGIYPVTTGAGLLGVKVEVVPVAADSVATFDHDNILSDAAGIPLISWFENIESRINAVVFGYDYEKEARQYRTYKETVNSESIDRYGKIPYYVLSKGIYSDLTDTDSLVAQISATLLTRYANAAPLLKVKTNMSLMTVDVGDIVTVDSDLIPNRENGTRGLTDALFEVVRRQVNFDRNNCDFDLMLWVENP